MNKHQIAEIVLKKLQDNNSILKKDAVWVITIIQKIHLKKKIIIMLQVLQEDLMKDLKDFLEKLTTI